MYKDVDGVRIELTDKEVAEIKAQGIIDDALREPAYVRPRQLAYTPLTEQIGYIIKCLKHLQASGIDLGSDGETLIAAIDAVKEKYPKNYSPPQD